MSYQKEISKKLMDYLSLKKYPYKKRGSVTMVKCPACGTEPYSTQKIPNVGKTNCFKCKNKHTITDYVRVIEPEYKDKPDEDIYKYLGNLFDIKVETEEDRSYITNLLKTYKKLGLSLTPLTRNSYSKEEGHFGKQAIENEWQKTQHDEIIEWEDWIKTGLNIGMVCSLSNITVLDLDIMPSDIKKKIYSQQATEEEKQQAFKKRDKNIKRILKALGNPQEHTAHQYSLGGIHIMFKYVTGFRKCAIKRKMFNIDVEHDNGYIVVEPSVVGGTSRKWVGDKINSIPEKLKKTLLSNMSKRTEKSSSDKNIIEEIKELKIKDLDGICNNTFIQLGGKLRKKLSPSDTAYALKIMNYGLLEDPMDDKSINSMCRQIEGYSNQDAKTLKDKIVDYLKDAESGRAAEIEIGVFGERPKGENKKIFAKALVDLIKDKRIRRKGNEYHIRKQTEWQTKFVSAAKPLPCKVPFFEEIANYHWGEMLLLGGVRGSGKTHTVMNIVKGFVKQGIKPYLVELEPAKKFIKVGMQLGLKEGDYYFNSVDPMEIEFPKNSIIIFDWILPMDYAKTDKMFYDLNQRLLESNSFLIALMQIRKNGEWFAPDLVEFFPSLSTRFILDDYKTKRDTGKFIIDKVNDPKEPRIWEIPTYFDKNTCEMKTIFQLEKENKK